LNEEAGVHKRFWWRDGLLGFFRKRRERKVYRIGYLSAPTRESVERIVEVFLHQLRDLGWIEGEESDN
jgi:hypothetical protein